jgi:hypothetical protein
MRLTRGLLLLVLLALPLAACGKGKACDPCDNVDDCDSGLTCQQFFDSRGNIRNLCGDANPFMTCPG